MVNARERELTFIPTHPDSYFTFSNKQVMTFARNLIDTSTTLQTKPKVLGTLYFDVDTALFDDMFASVKLGKLDRITLTGADGNVIYSNVKALMGKPLSVSDRQAANKDEYLLVQDNPDTGLSLTGRFSKSDLYSGLMKVKRYLAIVVVVCMLSLIVMSIAFSRRFSRPIREVIQMMTKMESGKLDVTVPVSSEDELGQLAHGFNRMTTRLNRFINDAYIAEIKRKQAELNALKGQIRPHYLYNTLEVVRMSAVANDDMPVADMIHALSNQLKYVLDYGQDIVPVREELEHVSDYVYLIRSRFGDRIELETFVAPDVSPEWGMMKLSIQPFIENAVQHGLKPKGNRGKIRISLERAGEADLKVTVYDDGVGMGEEKLDELRRILGGELQEGEGRKHVGLRNVHERLQSLFGPAYGIEIDSVPHVGTSVQFAMPVIREGVRYVETAAGR
jgi:two-component system sensor histidine kinase YesM